MSKIILLGGGNVGSTLLELLEEHNHKITIVEEDKDKCNDLATEKDIVVVNGDATDPKLLDEKELEDADFVLAVTGSEEANFLSGVYAKNAGAKKVICRVKSAKYSKLLQKLEITGVASEYSLAVELANMISSPTIYNLLNPFHSGLELVEKEADKDMIGKTILDIQLDKSAIVIAFVKGHKYAPAKLHVEIEKGMRLIILRERPKRII